VLAQLRDSGDWGRYHGPHSDQIYQAIAGTVGVENVHLCSSGTVAVELALRAAQVSPGDEVILSAYDFKANFTNIALLGATPVLVDCQESDAQLDVSQIEAAISGKTKAIIASHLQGGLVEIATLREIADRRRIVLIEDVCQAPGAIVAGRPAGAWGDIATFSFGGSKLITAGRGGAVITSRPELAQRIKLFTQRGNDAYPLSEMQAALLLPQWKQLETDNARRWETVRQLGDLPGLRRFGFPDSNTAGQLVNRPGREGEAPAEPHARDQARLEVAAQPELRPPSRTNFPAFYKVGFWYDLAAYAGLPRDRFCQALRAEGIPFDPGFAGLHQIHARRRFRAVGELPQATRACARVVMLHHPLLLEGPLAVEQIRAALDKVAQHATMLRDASLPTAPNHRD
jgi:perosamine synthetase